MSLAAISKHVKVLQKAGLVEKYREGPTHRCEINFSPVRNASALIHYFEQFLPPEGEAAAHESQRAA